MATTLSQAGSLQETLAKIQNNPLYTRELQDYYLTTYAPGLTQATFGINAARNAFQANEGARATQRGEAVRRIAGDYASRGMRTPSAINRDRSRVQGEFANLSREEQNRIMDLENQRDVQFGTGAQSGETFMTDPTSFGSIGAGAQQSALAGLTRLPELYNLLGMGASTAPIAEAAPAAQAAPQPVTIASLLPQAAAPAPVAAAPAPVAAAPVAVASTPAKAGTARKTAAASITKPAPKPATKSVGTKSGLIGRNAI
jgi:hypothetical protein